MTDEREQNLEKIIGKEAIIATGDLISHGTYGVLNNITFFRAIFTQEIKNHPDLLNALEVEEVKKCKGRKLMIYEFAAYNGPTNYKYCIVSQDPFKAFLQILEQRPHDFQTAKLVGTIKIKSGELFVEEKTTY